MDLFRKREPKGRQDDKRCAYCGKTMGPGRYGKRKYCNNACKQAAYRERQQAERE